LLAAAAADVVDVVDDLLGPLENLNVGSLETGFSGDVRATARAGVIVITSMAPATSDDLFLLRAAFELLALDAKKIQQQRTWYHRVSSSATWLALRSCINDQS
jgi:hypothetical protein